MKIPSQYELIMPIRQSRAMRQCKWLNLVGKSVTMQVVPSVTMQMVPSDGQICNQCKWRHLVAKFVTNASSATWWPKMEPMPIALNVGQIWNQYWWRHLVVKFWTNTSGTTYNWPNLEPMQVEFYVAGEITQVIDSIPWVRCASGNVFWLFLNMWMEGWGLLFSVR